MPLSLNSPFEHVSISALTPSSTSWIFRGTCVQKHPLYRFEKGRRSGVRTLFQLSDGSASIDVVSWDKTATRLDSLVHLHTVYEIDSSAAVVRVLDERYRTVNKYQIYVADPNAVRRVELVAGRLPWNRTCGHRVAFDNVARRRSGFHVSYMPDYTHVADIPKLPLGARCDVIGVVSKIWPSTGSGGTRKRRVLVKGVDGGTVIVELCMSNARMLTQRDLTRCPRIEVERGEVSGFGAVKIVIADAVAKIYITYEKPPVEEDEGDVPEVQMEVLTQIQALSADFPGTSTAPPYHRPGSGQP